MQTLPVVWTPQLPACLDRPASLGLPWHRQIDVRIAAQLVTASICFAALVTFAHMTDPARRQRPPTITLESVSLEASSFAATNHASPPLALKPASHLQERGIGGTAGVEGPRVLVTPTTRPLPGLVVGDVSPTAASTAPCADSNARTTAVRDSAKNSATSIGSMVAGRRGDVTAFDDEPAPPLPRRGVSPDLAMTEGHRDALVSRTALVPAASADAISKINVERPATEGPVAHPRVEAASASASARPVMRAHNNGASMRTAPTAPGKGARIVLRLAAGEKARAATSAGSVKSGRAMTAELVVRETFGTAVPLPPSRPNLAPNAANGRFESERPDVLTGRTTRRQLRPQPKERSLPVTAVAAPYDGQDARGPTHDGLGLAADAGRLATVTNARLISGAFGLITLLRR